MGKICYYIHVARLSFFFFWKTSGKNRDPWTGWACALFLICVCAVNLVGQVSRHVLTSVQAKHYWVRCVPDMWDLLCALSDVWKFCVFLLCLLFSSYHLYAIFNNHFYSLSSQREINFVEADIIYGTPCVIAPHVCIEGSYHWSYNSYKFILKLLSIYNTLKSWKHFIVLLFTNTNLIKVL